MAEHDFEKLGASMRMLADLIEQAIIVSIETQSQLEAFDRFTHHHGETVKAAKANDADAFVRHLEPAFHAWRIIMTGIADEQIIIVAGGA